MAAAAAAYRTWRSQTPSCPGLAAAAAAASAGGPDLRFLALPASVIGIAVVGVAASKVDSGFLEVLDKGALVSCHAR